MTNILYQCNVWSTTWMPKRRLLESCFVISLVWTSASVFATDCVIGDEMQPESPFVVLKRLQPKPNADEYMGVFLFRNEGNKEVTLPGFGPPRGGWFQPHFVGFEIERAGKWHPVLVGYDGQPARFAIPAKTDICMKIDLQSLPKQDEPLIARVIIGGHASAPFVIDLNADLASGRFEESRREYINDIRAALRRAGFRLAARDGDISLDQVLEMIFAPLDDLPIVGVGAVKRAAQKAMWEMDGAYGGQIRCDFHGDVIEDHEYAWEVVWVINTEKYVHSDKRHNRDSDLRIGTWGQARLLEWGERTVLSDPSAGIGYLEIKLRSSRNETMLSTTSGREVLTRVLDRIDQCFVDPCQLDE